MTCILNSFSQENVSYQVPWKANFEREVCVQGSVLRHSTWEKIREVRLDRRKTWTVMQFHQRLWSNPGAPWCCDGPHWGRGQPLYPCMDRSLDRGCPRKGYDLEQTAPFYWEQLLRSPQQAILFSSWENECVSFKAESRWQAITSLQHTIWLALA